MLWCFPSPFRREEIRIFFSLPYSKETFFPSHPLSHPSRPFSPLPAGVGTIFPFSVTTGLLLIGTCPPFFGRHTVYFFKRPSFRGDREYRSVTPPPRGMVIPFVPSPILPLPFFGRPVLFPRFKGFSERTNFCPCALIHFFLKQVFSPSQNHNQAVFLPAPSPTGEVFFTVEYLFFSPYSCRILGAEEYPNSLVPSKAFPSPQVLLLWKFFPFLKNYSFSPPHSGISSPIHFVRIFPPLYFSSICFFWPCFSIRAFLLDHFPPPLLNLSLDRLLHYSV